ncbi:glycosyltransferase family 2 protein [Alcaligenes ammonioxydans]|uniref:Glycosyltransferase n=1 Tax=Alcaligenes ammonioxydans TaxID=2582914 RepID=A0ABX8SW27_9BURK|nr:glycosyltransferase [Alcaligenes ammonioxydans]QXX80250.1 glycosyltransferase [Alcaligenes ammonioxydans]
MKFSVLMSLYAREKPIYLDQALNSLLNMTLLADEIVMVLDGPITDDLQTVLDAYSDRLPLKIIKLKQNQGLGRALNEGLKNCSFEWVARFDTDDINFPDRFEKQIVYIKKNPSVDIIGGWVVEFENSISDAYGLKKVPLNHLEIVKFAKYRNPFNHMTVMFKKKKVEDLGGYRDESLYEDYGLWVRLIQAGAKTANLGMPLVYARAGIEMIKRRGGWSYAINEYKFQRDFRISGFISYSQFLFNIMTRIPLRLLGGGVRFLFYKNFLRERK